MILTYRESWSYHLSYLKEETFTNESFKSLGSVAIEKDTCKFSTDSMLGERNTYNLGISVVFKGGNVLWWNQVLFEVSEVTLN